MLSPREILEKAETARTDLTTSGGALQTASMEKFLEIATDKAVVLRYATVVQMKSHTQVIDKLSLQNQVLQPETDGTELSAAERTALSLGKTTLTSVAFKGEIPLRNQVVEDNVERDQLPQTILRLAAQAVGRDMETVGLNGNTVSGATPFLLALAGLFQQATTNISPAAGAALTKPIFRDALIAMPSRFSQDPSKIYAYVPRNSEIAYRDSLADRGTVAGDKFVIENAPAMSFGMAVLGVPLIQSSGGTAPGLLTDPENVVLGVWKTITLEVDKDIRAGVVRIVVRTRFDVKFAEEPAAVKITSIDV